VASPTRKAAIIGPATKPSAMPLCTMPSALARLAWSVTSATKASQIATLPADKPAMALAANSIQRAAAFIIIRLAMTVAITPKVNSRLRPR
jgi:hypothetical protein